MNIDTTQASELLQTKDKILILTHKNPDGDTLGSAFALCRALLKLKKSARVMCNDAIPQKYDYMFENMISADFEPEFVVAVDVADTKLLGQDVERRYAKCVDLCIDHHGSNINYAKQTCLCPEDSATAEIIYRVVKKLEVGFDPDIANCIYTGLSTDTGCFRYSNVTSNTHRIAAEMIEAGAKSADINCLMFESKTVSFLKLQKMCIDGMQLYFNDKCAIVTLTQDMFEKSGSNESECEAISALPRQIEGVLVGATLKEKPDGTYKVSVRTHAPIDAAKICSKMNGGGHKRAGGCEIKLPLEQARKVLLGHIGTAIEEVCAE